MKYLKVLVLSLSLTISALGHANLINDMQSCQALNQFVINKLLSDDSPYTKQDSDNVVKGLVAYNAYIQSQIVSPGLLAFNNGDVEKAQEMQEQVDSYKEELQDSFEQRYPNNKMVSDYAITINNCAQKAVPSGQDLTSLKAALTTLLAMAQR